MNRGELYCCPYLILQFMNKRIKYYLFSFFCGFCLINTLAQVPNGYSIVWADDFNDPSVDGKPIVRANNDSWWYETGNGGWGNNELQYYIAGINGSDTLAAISNGTLKIKAIQKNIGTSQYASIRMNTVQSWKYGYFEMRAKMPTGKGTWPAFWMLPKNFQSWPLDGEIDIMEYVGYDPNRVHGSIHTMSYNHSIGTQRTSNKIIQNAETEFHTYALLWTEEKIRIYVDGYNYFTFSNDGTNNKDTWPFNAPFYLKLNLAVGGNWGGAMGVDTNIFPATYEIDYVRVYQNTTAINETKEEKLIDSNFNNVSNLLQVNFKEEGIHRLSVTDIKGRIIKKIETTDLVSEIDCSGWPKGFYLVSANSGKSLFTQKFLKY